MKAKELIDLLQRVDDDTKIIVWGECNPRRHVTLWDWTDTHGAVVLVETDKQDWVRHESTTLSSWSKRVKYEYKELSGRIARLRTFLETDPKISEQDMLLLKSQLGIMKDYANILLARLHYHNVKIDEEIVEEES